MIDALASESRYLDHLAPVWRALPSKGTFYISQRLMDRAVLSHGLSPSELTPIAQSKRAESDRIALVASYQDQRRWGPRPAIVFEHGCGQSYSGDPISISNPSYAGGDGRESAIAFVVPGDLAAFRWRAHYPDVPVFTVGAPHLDEWHRRAFSPGPEPAIAVSFHADVPLVPETTWAFPWFERALPALARRFPVLGHGHPRFWGHISRAWKRMGIEPVRDFDDVLARADLYIVDNSSTAMEFASTGRPIVLLNSPRYRRDVEHGGRFWEWARAWPTVDDPDDLIPTVERALAEPVMTEQREAALARCYHARDGLATWRASQAVQEVLSGYHQGLRRR